MMPALPAIFFGHGNPMNAVLDNEYTRQWSAIGRSLPKPKAVLSVSAHWYLPQTGVTVNTAPRTIHDFGGFPRELYLMASKTGLWYWELAVVPLSVGAVTPAQVPAGSSVEIRGSGFVAGTSVAIGGLAAACIEVDSEHLSCTVPAAATGAASMTLTNPDGQNYSIESALTIQ